MWYGSSNLYIRKVIAMHLPDSVLQPFRRDAKYAAWVPLYLLLFLLLEQWNTTNYWDTQLPVDAQIPFCEWFIIPYCLWYPFLIFVGIYLLMRDSNAFRRYMYFLSASFFLSLLIWFLIPNGQNLRPAVMPRDNVLTALIANLYSIDTNTNVFPSVHVVGSIGAALAVWDCAALRHHKWTVLTATLLAFLICLSVVFVKQHAFLDLVSGLLLSALVSIPIYLLPRVRQKYA